MTEPTGSSGERPRYAAFVVALGGLLVASGLAHTALWLAAGESLEGPVSLRKPILFGFSAGATVISIGWLMTKLRPRTGDAILAISFGIAMVLEVGLITMQHWRGVPSHFNSATPFDAAVLGWIEWLVIFATLVIAELTRRSFGRLPSTSDMSLAIRGGMVLLLVSCLIGFVLVAHGNRQVALGKSPETFGAAGVMKFPHGVPMHAIQLLPILAWTLARMEVSVPRRWIAVAAALGATLVFTGFALLQTFSGRARFDLNWISATALAATATLAAVPLAVGLPQLARRTGLSRS